MLLTPIGIATLVRTEHQVNAPAPMLAWIYTETI